MVQSWMATLRNPALRAAGAERVVWQNGNGREQWQAAPEAGVDAFGRSLRSELSRAAKAGGVCHNLGGITRGEERIARVELHMA